MSERADVYKSGILAATLTKTPQGVELRYLDEYISRALTPIASTLPVTELPRTTPAGAVPPYFAGLLPEGRRLTRLRQTIKAAADDEFSLLLAVGGDTIGDVQIVEHGQLLSAVEPLLTIPDEPNSIRFSEALEAEGIIDPVGIPGAQDKISGRMISVPAQSAADRVILKLNPPEYPHVVDNEAYFLNLAREAGIPTVDARVVHDADGTPGLLIARFDRLRTASGETMLGCEDACQALDRWPADKYSMTAENAALGLTRLCASPAVAARDVFRQVVFALLTGNGDQHAKNLSILTNLDGESRIAPAYDLPSTLPYGDSTVALTISGRSNNISRKRILEFAENIGLRQRAAQKVLDALLASTANLIGDLDAGALPFDGPRTAKMIAAVRNRRRLLSP